MKTSRTDFMLPLPTDWTPELALALAVHDLLVAGLLSNELLLISRRCHISNCSGAGILY